MNREYEIKDVLNMLSYKGIPFPGLLLKDSNKVRTGIGNSVLRKKDANGYWYFMPVSLIYKGKDYELPNAIISVSNKKIIVETPMVGRQGSVKELISMDDYEIAISGALIDKDFPDIEIDTLNQLYSVNAAIGLKSALTDIFMKEEDKVIIKSIDFAAMKGTENVQLYNMKLTTDRSFELIIE